MLQINFVYNACVSKEKGSDERTLGRKPRKGIGRRWSNIANHRGADHTYVADNSTVDWLLPNNGETKSNRRRLYKRFVAFHFRECRSKSSDYSKFRRFSAVRARRK
ncbi:uncharacterized protein LOC112461494 [Temnothorax curvispinosus]|uniref:Uncharacterized protein LOC112461494 n=1 Tax=Temnothorax curvispinosus TaxID=300111 RepID=A0A6J1QJC4_9HYME|nr:uncharacterized protein LOC112461494 [Temnothorax curvispinosus]